MKRPDKRNGKSIEAYFFVVLLAINKCDLHNWMSSCVA